MRSLQSEIIADKKKFCYFCVTKRIQEDEERTNEIKENKRGEKEQSNRKMCDNKVCVDFCSQACDVTAGVTERLLSLLRSLSLSPTISHRHATTQHHRGPTRN